MAYYKISDLADLPSPTREEFIEVSSGSENRKVAIKNLFAAGRLPLGNDFVWATGPGWCGLFESGNYTGFGVGEGIPETLP